MTTTPTKSTYSVDLVIPSMRNGDATSQHTFDLARFCQQKAYTVRILSNHKNGPIPSDISPFVLDMHPTEYIWDADVTILQYAVWFSLAEAVNQTKKSVIYWYHGVTPPALWGQEAERDILSHSENRTFLAWYAHLAVTDSPFTAEELHRHSGYPRERIRVIPLGVDVTSFQQRPSDSILAQLRTQWGLAGKRILLFVGRVVGNKRVDLLIDAMAELAPKYPDLHLLVVGENSGSDAYQALSKRLQAQVDSLQLSQRVTFTGRVERIEPYYHLADIYALPSLHEGFGVPLIEAMAAEIPIVASASGSMPWVLGFDESNLDDSTGLLFEPGQATHLAQQVKQLLDNPDLCHTLVERGRQRVDYFSLERFNQRVDQLLMETINMAKQGPPPIAAKHIPSLYEDADISMRSYKVRSHAAVVGPLIEWVRHNSTTHLKEAYLDPIIEQQVNYNRLIADEVEKLQQEIMVLKEQVRDLQSKQL